VHARRKGLALGVVAEGIGAAEGVLIIGLAGGDAARRTAHVVSTGVGFGTHDDGVGYRVIERPGARRAASEELLSAVEGRELRDV
nr:hypothetical protein [Tanacetum cinerariifolium]